MKQKRNLLITIFVSALLGWTLGFLRLPYIEKNFSFLLGFIACLCLVFLVGIISSVWEKNKSNKNTSKSYSTTWLSFFAFILAGGLVSSFLINRQSDFFKHKIKSQDDVLKEQTKLLAASRRSNAIVIMKDIFDEIDTELKNNPQRILSDELIAKMNALNTSFHPFQKLESDSLSKIKLSPERGQLLLMLAAMNINADSFNKIKSTTSFLGADLEGANLKGIDLSGINLMGANLKDANLSGANLSQANLEKANFWGCQLNKANLENIVLKYASLRWAELDSTNLIQANLYGADLRDAKIRNADANKTNLEWAKLNGAFLNKTNLTKSKMRGANLSRANLSEANLTESNLTLCDFSEAILTKVNLSEMNLGYVGVAQKDWLDKLQEWQVVGAKGIKEKHHIVVDELYKTCNFRIMSN